MAKAKTGPSETERSPTPAAERAGPATRKAEGAVRAQGAVRQRSRTEGTGAASASRGAAAGLGQGLFGGYERLAEVGTENIKVAVAAGAILLEGLEALSREAAVCARESLAAGVEAAGELSACTSFAEAVDRQSAFARRSLEGLAAQTEKLAGLSIQTAKEALEPINARIAATADAFIEAAAGKGAPRKRTAA